MRWTARCAGLWLTILIFIGTILALARVQHRRCRHLRRSRTDRLPEPSKSGKRCPASTTNQEAPMQTTEPTNQKFKALARQSHGDQAGQRSLLR
jgi:hypothetical protein